MCQRALKLSMVFWCASVGFEKGLTGRENAVMDQAGRFPRYGYLAPKWAIFVEQAGDVTASVLESRAGILVELGFLNSAQSLVANGNYALWSIAGTLI